MIVIHTRAKKIKANGLAVRKLRVEINGQTDRSDCVTVLAGVDGNKQGISLVVSSEHIDLLSARIMASP